METREQAICQAALELLAEVGYDRMSMDALAARAHASKATIYRRWPGKHELVLDAVRNRAAHEIVPRDTGSLRGDLLEVLRTIATTLGAEDAALMAGVLRAMRTAPELADCMCTQVLEDKRAISRTIVARAVARGEVEPDTDPDLVHEIAPAMTFMRRLVTGQPLDEAFFRHVTDDVLMPLLTLCRATPTTEKEDR